MSNEPEKPELPSDEEIEARFSKIKENLTVDLEAVDEKLADILDKTKASEIETHEFDARLEELDAKARAMKQRREQQQAQAAKETRLYQESTQGLGMGLTIAYTIIGVPLVGGLIGLLIDRATNSNIWIVVFGMGGMVAGVGYAIFLISRNNKNQSS